MTTSAAADPPAVGPGSHESVMGSFRLRDVLSRGLSTAPSLRRGSLLRGLLADDEPGTRYFIGHRVRRAIVNIAPGKLTSLSDGTPTATLRPPLACDVPHAVTHEARKMLAARTDASARSVVPFRAKKAQSFGFRGRAFRFRSGPRATINDPSAHDA